MILSHTEYYFDHGALRGGRRRHIDTSKGREKGPGSQRHRFQDFGCEFGHLACQTTFALLRSEADIYLLYRVSGKTERAGI